MSQFNLERAAADLEGKDPLVILHWAADQYAGRLVFSTGFGPDGCLLIDLIGRHRLAIDIVTLDTGLLFPETHDLWRRLEARYGLEIRAIRPRLTVSEQERSEGPRLWERDPDRCCALRKVHPLREALAGYAAWISSVRRDQTRHRAAAAVVEWDSVFGLVKINPLVAWSATEIWDYLRRQGVPFNPLHERGFASIGCWPCTSPIEPGEDPRAGRWRGTSKTECGLHVLSPRKA